MSAYAESETVMTDETYLVEALKAMGFNPTVNKEPVTLTDYHGGRRLAHVVLPKGQPGYWGAVGFFKSDGTYRAVIDDYDKNGVGGHTRLDDRWLGRVSQNYSEARAMSVARTKGYTFAGREVVTTEQGQRVKLRFTVGR